jgi:GT2 family glycosyltransferase/glycosyltransferase involved in cell wall biosynthesis
MPAPRVSAIVVNYRKAEMTCDCLVALSVALGRLDGPSEMVVVDNGSGDGSVETIRAAVPEAAVHSLPDNLGFPTAASEGIRRSSGEWVLLLNNDVIVEPDAVSEMVLAGEGAPDVGSVAAQMRFASDPRVINSAGIGVDRLGIAFDRLLGASLEASETRPVEVFGASGGAALHRRRMLDDIGGMDETYFFALDDADLAWRARMAGWRCLYAPGAVVHHHHGATTAHGSSRKYFHVGLNRVRTVAKNADARLLRRYGPAMVAYDLGYVAFAAATDRTLAPLRGRVRGLREWRGYRRAGAPRRPVELEPVRGLGAALGRRAVWNRHSAVGAGGEPKALAVFHLGGVGGPQRSLVQAMTWLGERGSVEFIVPEDGAAADEYEPLGPVTVANYTTLTYARGVRRVASAALDLARDVRFFRRELRRRRPDVVVVVTTVLPAVLIAARLERVPSVVYAAEIFTQQWKGDRLRLWGEGLARATGALAGGLVCCSETVARQFPVRNRKPIAVAYPPIGREYARGDRDRGRARYGVDAADPCLLVVGNVSRGRGQDVALRALPSVRRNHPAARLLIVGAPHPRPVDIEYAGELRRRAEDLGVADAVVFADPTDAMADVYAAADVVLNPARFAEPFGRVAPEALMAGRPVVASRVGAIPEVLTDGVDGLLVPPDDPEALAAAVARLIEDAGLAESLARRGRDRVAERFGYAQDRAAWTRVLTGVLPGRLEGPAPADDRGDRLEEDLDVLAK